MKLPQTSVFSWLEDTLSLLYPRLCLLCNAQVQQGDDICLSCEHRLPKAEHYLTQQNDFTAKFYGRTPIVFGAARYLFGVDGSTKRLIHQFKYQNKPQIGYWVGKQFGLLLSENSVFPKVDVIVPVPLHPEKLFKRGYNQSEWLAKGFSESLNILLNTDAFVRKIYTETQTKKSRAGRLENVKSAFTVVNTKALENKHILLVDDVSTTGATLESCASCIMEACQNVQISMVTMAMAE